MRLTIGSVLVGISSLAAVAGTAHADVFVPPPPPAASFRFVSPHVDVEVGSAGYRPGYYTGGGYGGYGGGGYNYGGGYGPAAPRWGYGRGGWHNPAIFASRIRQEMAVVDNDLRYHVETGTVSPQALPALEAGRQEIERDLAEACSRGVISRVDREHLEQHVQELRDLRDRYRSDAPGFGYDSNDE